MSSKEILEKEIFFIHLRETHKGENGKPNYQVPYGTVAVKAIGKTLFLSGAFRSRKDHFSYKIGRNISSGRLISYLDKGMKGNYASINPNLLYHIESEHNWTRESIIAILKRCDIQRLKGEPTLIIR